MEGLYRMSVGDHYSDLAHHYSHSDNAQKAVEYLGLAGHQAARRSANDEAIEHFTTALEVLQTLLDSPERSHQELTLLVALGVPLMATKGHSTPQVENIYLRDRELCEQVGDTPETFPTLYGLWAFYSSRAECKQAHELGKQLLRLAQSQQDPALLMVAHEAMGVTLLHLGDLASSRTYLEHGSALYDSQQHHALAFTYSVDPGIGCLFRAAEALWHLGYPDRALKSSHEALTLAQELSQPFSQTFALNFTTWLHLYRREGQAAQDQAEGVIALSTEQGFPVFLAMGSILRGWALAAQWHIETGLSQLRDGLAALQATGSEVCRSQFFALLAETYGQGGQAEEGLAAVAEALAFVERTEERYCEAELYRLKGELTLKKSQVESQKPVLSGAEGSQVEEEAEAYFQKAIAIAQKQEAKSWELRAATSLARLWQQQGKKQEARDLLGPVYNWFTGGFDTADLKDAKALLDALST